MRFNFFEKLLGAPKTGPVILMRFLYFRRDSVRKEIIGFRIDSGINDKEARSLVKNFFRARENKIPGAEMALSRDNGGTIRFSLPSEREFAFQIGLKNVQAMEMLLNFHGNLEASFSDLGSAVRLELTIKDFEVSRDIFCSL